jgi:hypothetical protein
VKKLPQILKDNIADSVGTAWWGSCSSSGDVTRYWDSLSGQWIGRNEPVVSSRRLFDLQHIVYAQRRNIRDQLWNYIERTKISNTFDVFQ